MGYISNPGDMFIRGASASGLIWGAANNTPPFQPTIVVPSANPTSNATLTGVAGNLKQRRYDGYYADNLSFFTGATPVNTAYGRPEVNEPNLDYYTMMWTGYIYSPTFGDYVIETTSDDSSMLWVGDKAISGYTVNNADVNNGGLHGSLPKDTLPNVIRMEQGWYPVRIVFGEASGNAYMAMRMYKYGSSSNEYLSFSYNPNTPEGFIP